MKKFLTMGLVLLTALVFLVGCQNEQAKQARRGAGRRRRAATLTSSTSR